MRKSITLLAVLLVIAFRGFAQDTITGTVNRVAAPYFEQNVCDTRFAIVSEDNTYYVMVDDYWPNPYLEDLVIHYDTIPIGNEIEVVGTIVEMEDGNGDVFRTIDISKNLSSNHRQILGFFGYGNIAYPSPDPVSAARFYHYNGQDKYYITINGELQKEKPLMVNGRTLIESKRYLFFGVSDSWTDYNGNAFNVFELIDALPYDIEDLNVSGTFTTENDLCLTWPRKEDLYLSLFDGETHRYVTNKGTLKNRYTNYEIPKAFGVGSQIILGGFEAVRYDLFGQLFNTIEAINIQTEEGNTLVGFLGDAPMPYVGMGVPVPGLDMAFCYYGDYYMKFYINNPLVWDPQTNNYLYDDFMIGNYTIYYEPEQEATVTFIPRMILNNYRNSIFYIIITEINDFDGVQELNSTEVQVFPNPANDIIYVSNTDQTIKRVDVMDSKGSIILSEPCNGNKIQFSNLGIRGLLFLRIELGDGNIAIKKIVLK